MFLSYDSHIIDERALGFCGAKLTLFYHWGMCSLQFCGLQQLCVRFVFRPITICLSVRLFVASVSRMKLKDLQKWMMSSKSLLLQLSVTWRLACDCSLHSLILKVTCPGKMRRVDYLYNLSALTLWTSKTSRITASAKLTASFSIRQTRNSKSLSTIFSYGLIQIWSFAPFLRIA